jgi:CheY-like chemotaxis protein
MKVGSYVQVVVSDTGTGIDVAIQPHIFEPFFTTKEIGKGTGLGLATVYGIVRQSGGTVWVHSEPNHGTVFEIYLPRTTATAAASAEESQPEAPRLKFETVLLVEDERALRELTCECLEAEGYEVLGAQDGQQALEICQRHQGEIDLLVSDVVMPGISGPELAQRLLKLRPRMKVMLVSGYSDEVISARSKLELGMAFIQKPCPPSEFRRRVRELLDAKDDRAD